jgi:hypothetical protein
MTKSWWFQITSYNFIPTANKGDIDWILLKRRKTLTISEIMNIFYFWRWNLNEQLMLSSSLFLSVDSDCNQRSWWSIVIGKRKNLENFWNCRADIKDHHRSVTLLGINSVAFKKWFDDEHMFSINILCNRSFLNDSEQSYKVMEFVKTRSISTQRLTFEQLWKCIRECDEFLFILMSSVSNSLHSDRRSWAISDIFEKL